MNHSRYVVTLAPVLFVAAIALGVTPSPAMAQAPKLTKNLFSHVMKSADVDAQFAKVTDSWDAYTKPNSGVQFRIATTKKDWTPHTEADEYWIVRKGAAKVALQTGNNAARDVAAGDVVYVPRAIAYQIDPSSRFEYIALRIFPPTQAGPAPTPAPTSYFASKADIDKTFATEPASKALRFLGGGSINQIIYNAAIGPYESHEDSDQVYFVRHGSAKMLVDGRLVNPTVTAPGQIRGTGAIDASEFTIGPGDIVWVPRNTLHFVDPGAGRVGYLLSTIPMSQSALPKPPTAPARGAGAGQ